MTEVRPRKVTYTYTPDDLVTILAEHLSVERKNVTVIWNITENRDAFDRAMGGSRLDTIDIEVKV